MHTRTESNRDPSPADPFSGRQLQLGSPASHRPSNRPFCLRWYPPRQSSQLQGLRPRKISPPVPTATAPLFSRCRCHRLPPAPSAATMTSEPPSKKKCLGADCDNDAGSLQCPTCLKLGVKDSYFCSQECFKKNWVWPGVSLFSPSTTHRPASSLARAPVVPGRNART